VFLTIISTQSAWCTQTAVTNGQFDFRVGVNETLRRKMRRLEAREVQLIT
jgi:hypothetical protein